MAEEPENKTVNTKAASPRKKTTKAKSTAAANDLQKWETVTYDGRKVTVTAVDKRDASVYLDSPVCSWVDVSEVSR